MQLRPDDGAEKRISGYAAAADAVTTGFGRVRDYLLWCVTGGLPERRDPAHPRGLGANHSATALVHMARHPTVLGPQA